MKVTTSETGKPLRNLLTVRMLHERYPAWSESSLRALILNSADRINSRGETIPGNGLDAAILRCEGKVLIDEELFIEWVAAQSMRGRPAIAPKSSRAAATETA